MNDKRAVPTLIYDGNCPLCRMAVDWVVAQTRPGAIELLTCQSEERAQRFPDIPLDQCMQAVQLAMSDGDIYAGDRSLPHLFLIMRRWRWMARLLQLPGMSLLSSHVYAFVARHRHMLSVLVYEKLPTHEGACGSESTCEDSNPIKEL